MSDQSSEREELPPAPLGDQPAPPVPEQPPPPVEQPAPPVPEQPPPPVEQPAPPETPESVRPNAELSNWSEADHYEPVHDAPLVLEPDVDTVRQGRIGDCHLISSMDAISAAEPEHWKSHLQDHGDTATVTLYDDGQPVPVTVEKSIPANGGGDPVGATTADGSTYGPLVEKAYASEFAGNDYGELDQGGYPHEALEALTGRPGYADSPANLGSDQVRELVDDGHPVVAGSRATGDLTPEVSAERGWESGQLPIPDGPHAYAVTGVDSDGTVHLHNPWGDNHLALIHR